MGKKRMVLMIFQLLRRLLLILLLILLLLLQCSSPMFLTVEATVQEKADATMQPVPHLSPPEGNMTFIDGMTWCVALPSVSQLDLQNALDWACGLGMADCRPIQSGGPCFDPNTLVSHASYAFNSYYQQNGNSDVACNFGGTATLVKRDPSYGKCSYAGPGSAKSSAPGYSKYTPSWVWGKFTGVVLLLLYFGSL